VDPGESSDGPATGEHHSNPIHQRVRLLGTQYGPEAFDEPDARLVINRHDGFCFVRWQRLTDGTPAPSTVLTMLTGPR